MNSSGRQDELVYGSDEKAKAKSSSRRKASAPGVVAVNDNSDHVLFGKEKAKSESSSRDSRSKKGSRSKSRRSSKDRGDSEKSSSRSRRHRHRSRRHSSGGSSSKSKSTSRSTNEVLYGKDKDAKAKSKAKASRGNSKPAHKSGVERIDTSGAAKPGDKGYVADPLFAENKKESRKESIKPVPIDGVVVARNGNPDEDQANKDQKKGGKNAASKFTWKWKLILIIIIIIVGIAGALLIFNVEEQAPVVEGETTENQSNATNATSNAPITTSTPAPTLGMPSSSPTFLNYDAPDESLCKLIAEGQDLPNQDTLSRKNFQLTLQVNLTIAIDQDLLYETLEEAIQRIFMPELAGCDLVAPSFQQGRKRRSLREESSSNDEHDPDRFWIRNGKVLDFSDEGYCEDFVLVCFKIGIRLEIFVMDDDDQRKDFYLLARLLKVFRADLATRLEVDNPPFQSIQLLSQKNLDPTVQPSSQPSLEPSKIPTDVPTANTLMPSSRPSIAPVTSPTTEPPTKRPTSPPSPSTSPPPPTTMPVVGQTPPPTLGPTPPPTPGPTPPPTLGPTPTPTPGPTSPPTPLPTPGPTPPPTPLPTPGPTSPPTPGPTPGPTKEPSVEPSKMPSTSPSNAPTTLRSKVESILAPYQPLDEATMTWLTETSTWVPAEGDANSDYLWLERYTLALFYASTNGQSWSNNDKWLSSEPVCNWKGLTAGSCPGPILSMSLNNNDLAGSIPSDIGNLSSLTDLGLSGNQLTGSIPSEIGNLNSVTTLSLARNQLTGSIPSEIGNLNSLTTLALRDNQLTGSIPSEIGNLISLKDLWLHDNQLAGSIPSSIGNLNSLTTLALIPNSFIGTTPSSICNLSRVNSASKTALGC